MKKLMIGALASFCVVGPISASAELPSIPFQGTWHTNVEATERGHAVGNPEALTTLIEFVSYTCSHCASFAVQGDPALELAFVAPGHTRVEYRPVIRNAVDLTATLLVECGDPSNFKNNHAMFLRSQGEWLTKASNAPQSQQAIWARGDIAARVNMANALGFITKMENRGYSRAQINSCLRDETEAQRLIDNDEANAVDFPIVGTPSFALDGALLTDVHGWGTLYPVLSNAVLDAQQKEAEKSLPDV